MFKDRRGITSHVGFARPTGDRTEFGHNCVTSARKPALRGGNARTSDSVGEHRHRLSSAPAYAQEASRDRADFDAAAGRHVFENVLLADPTAFSRRPRATPVQAYAALERPAPTGEASLERAEFDASAGRRVHASAPAAACRARLRARKPSCPRDLALTLWTMKSGARSGRVCHRFSLVRRPSSGSASTSPRIAGNPTCESGRALRAGRLLRGLAGGLGSFGDSGARPSRSGPRLS